MKFLLTAVLFFSSLTANAQVASNEKVALTTTNTVVFRGEVSDSSVLAIELKLIKLVLLRGKKDYPLYLVLDSPGGSIDAGQGFIEFAKMIRNLNTVSIFAASMASGIAEALPGKRLVTNNGIMMFHRAAGRFQGYFETGEVESILGTSKVIVQQLENTNSGRMRMSITDYKGLVQNELWLFSTMNITYRAADKIVDLVCSKQLIESRDSVAIETMFGTIGLTFSGCPLLRGPKGGSTDKYLVPSLSNYRIIATKWSERAK